MDTELACVGLVTLDILGRHIDRIPEGGKTELIQQIRLTPAGTAAGAALNAAKLGVRTALVAAVGADDMGRYLEESLRALGVDTRYLQRRQDMPSSATILAVSSRGDRPNFHAVGASIMLEIDAAARECLLKSRHVHWCAGTLLMLDGPPSAEILREAKARGVTTSCDFIAPGEHTLPALEAVLSYVDYFMPSLEEAMEVAGTKTPEDTAKFYMDRGAGNCIFKWGARGSWLATPSQQKRIPAFKVDVVDTTGCGDSYCAGFIAARLRGWDFEQSCRFATATSALVATGLGSDAGVVDFETTLKAMETLPILEV